MPTSRSAEGYGQSEKIIGRWLASRDCPEEVTIFTKVSFDNSLEHIDNALRAYNKGLSASQQKEMLAWGTK